MTARAHDAAIRVAVESPADADPDALLALLRASFAFMDGRIDPPSSLARLDRAALAAKIRDEAAIVARAGGRIVGCAFARIDPDAVYVGKVAVDASTRRRGVARLLLDEAAALARRHGRRALELQVRVELSENRAAFEALGFQVVGRTAHPGYDRPTSLTLRRTLAD